MEVYDLLGGKALLEIASQLNQMNVKYGSIVNMLVTKVKGPTNIVGFLLL
jgi:hypothetical protein